MRKKRVLSIALICLLFFNSINIFAFNQVESEVENSVESISMEEVEIAIEESEILDIDLLQNARMDVFSATSLAAPITVDFTGSVNNATPVGFNAISLGWTNPKPTVTIVAGALGKSPSDVSGCLTSGEGVSTIPFVRKDLNLPVPENNVINVGFKMAALDLNSDKVVYLTMEGNKQTTPKNAFTMSKDGNLYIFDEMVLESYELNTWYSINIVFIKGVNECSAYINGNMVADGIPFSPNQADTNQLLSVISQFYYSTINKTSNALGTSLLFDDLYIGEDEIDDRYKTTATSEIVNIDNKAMKISNLLSYMTAEDLTNAINVPLGASIEFVKPDGNSFDAERLYTGVRVKITSANEKIQVYYTIENLNVTILSPTDGSYVRPGDDLELQLYIPEGEPLSHIEVYQDNVLIQTITQAPYVATVTDMKQGTHSYFAKVYNMEGISVASKTVTIICKPNTLPSVSFTSLTNGTNLPFDKEIKETVNAADLDGTVERVELYMNGDIVGTSYAAPYEFRLPKIAGKHQVYAAAYDNDGGVSKTNVINILIAYTVLDVVDNNDFTEGFGNWFTTGAGTADSDIIKFDDIRGNVFYLKTLETTTSDPFISVKPMVSAKVVGYEFSVEADIMFETTPVNISLFTLRSNATPVYFNTDAQASGNTFTGVTDKKNKQITPGQWYHLKYDVDLANKITKFYVDGELLNTNNSADTDGTLYDIRFTFRRAAIFATYIDNLKITKKVAYPYVDSVKYFKNNQEITLQDGVAPYTTEKIEVKFSSNIEKGYINDNTISVYAKGQKVDNYIITQKADNPDVAEIKFLSALYSLEDYTIKVSDKIKDHIGNFSVSPYEINFKTGPMPYDVVSWDLNEINNKISLTATLSNTTSAVKNSVLILTLFEGDVMVGYSAKPITVPAGGQYITEKIDITTTSSNITSVEGYVWRSMTNRAPEINKFVFYK